MSSTPPEGPDRPQPPSHDNPYEPSASPPPAGGQYGSGGSGPGHYGGGQYGGPSAPPYGAPPPGYGPPPSPRNGMGIAALVLGIVAVLLCWTVAGGIILGILGLIFGIVGWRRVRRNEATNGAMSIIGAVLGAVGLILAVILLAVGASLIGSLLNSGEFQSYQDCVRSAQTQQERAQCAQEFRQDLRNQ